MALVITPAVDKWLHQTDAFTIVFKAYDDNGNLCRNKEMSIQYSITYDGTMPDITQMQRIYSDASGVIALVIANPCVISIYGRHVHDVNDLSKGEVVQEIAVNYEITFQPIILNMTATYTGPEVEITADFDTSYLSITSEMSNGEIKNIPISECIIEDYQIYTVGPNIKTLTYTDQVLGTVWNLNFVVNGVPKLISLEAEYIGQRKVLGAKILDEEVRVYSTFLIAIDTTERKEESNWFFIDIPIINESNNGVFRIGYKKFSTTITVPYDIVTSLRLNVWYEGDKIEVGKSYDPNNVVVYLVYPDGERKRISWKHCTIDSYLVEKEGLNWYTITYNFEFNKITQEFPVEGIIYKDYEDLDFKVLYITDMSSTKEENQENLTGLFEDGLTFQGVLLISWNQFLNVVNKTGKYGLYIVTVPKLSGLSNQYDMDWEVLCINKNTIKASIKKIYNKEEEKDGEDKDNFH